MLVVLRFDIHSILFEARLFIVFCELFDCVVLVLVDCALLVMVCTLVCFDLMYVVTLGDTCLLISIVQLNISLNFFNAFICCRGRVALSEAGCGVRGF